MKSVVHCYHFRVGFRVAATELMVAANTVCQ